MGVLTASGGACDIIADQAPARGIEIPPFAPATAAAIAPHVPPFAQVRNPLDVTGYFLANQRTSALTAIDHALDAAVADPGLDFVLFSGLTLPDARPADEKLASMLDERVAWLGQRMASAPDPGHRGRLDLRRRDRVRPGAARAGTASTCSAAWTSASRPSRTRSAGPRAAAGRGRAPPERQR